MRTSNPVLTRLGQAAARERVAGSGYPAAGGYAAPPTVRTMTVDDVVVRTVAMLAIIGVVGAATWAVVPVELSLAAAVVGSVPGLILGLVIAFSRITNPFVIGAYAVAEGVFMGAWSQLFESRYPGIVLQAVGGTFGVFFVMAALYKVRAIRATPRFVRGVIAAMIGCAALMLVNLVLWFFHIDSGLRSGGPLAIGFSLVCIVVASLSFVLSFAEVEQAVRYGMPERYAWYVSFGIVLSLVWLYLEILRLLGYLRE
ncbi:Bax inhibitor-1/YccA family protein [Rhizomonospora bruguierae]|uniref:Bax inhibitor-1/YccA family protein n=1 Tax=Rhizomonospora bruguierae TaxID=1581705 RepID=UPI001BD10459|nr:Bax inhibitor-1/YccA family protein [Micromonospora sp. NBRC 107566]